jgi:agmatinase
MFIVKIPAINGLGKTNGCEKAGNEILKELKNLHSSEQGKPIEFQLLDLEEIHVNNSDIEYSNKLIYENCKEIFETYSKTLFLGGDHSISFSTGRAFLEHCKERGKEPCLIVFDAHADCMKPMKEPTHEEWLRALVEIGFPAENILLVGVRNMWKDELIFLKEKKISVLNLNSLEENLQDICDTIMEFSTGKELYLSIDIDVLDPCFAPATGYPESGGLSARQFLYLTSRLNKIRSLRAVDLVEINPDKDKSNRTIKLGAKILGEFL